LAGALAIVAGSAALAASPGDKVYTIANYPVEATAKDAVAAKERAHADGQQAALGALLKRLVPVTAYNRVDQLKNLRADDFIDGVAIRSESNSSTQYIASLDVSFQPDAVRNLLRSEGVPFVEEQAPRMVLVPVMIVADEKGGPRYRPASGSWAQVWKGLDLDNTLTPLRIEQLLPVIHDDTINAAIAGDDSVERVLTSEYKADFVLLAAAEIDAEAKKVNVTLAGIDAAGMVSWKRAYRVQNGDTAYAMELAAVVTQGVLEGRWKAAKQEGQSGVGGFTAGGGGASDVHLAVEFSSLGEWNDLRRQLLDLPGVDDVRIGAVSARTAEVSLRYPGGGDRLAQTLSGQGLSLTDAGGGFWTLRAGY
jgi:hypothetical protein